MRQTAVILLSLFFPIAMSWTSGQAGVTLRVNEAETRAWIQEEKIDVSLAIENPSARAIEAGIRLELIEASNKVRAEDERQVSISPGKSRLALNLSTASLHLSDHSKLLWHRLRYRIGEVEGIISISEITPELFELKIASSYYAAEGEVYRVAARAIHPAKLHPVRGVSVDARVRFFDDDSAPDIESSAVTDRDGYAIFDFRLPEKTSSRTFRIHITGRLGGFEQEAEEDFSIEHLAWIAISPDKPIYQPGQTLRARLLVRDMVSRRAVADAPVTVRIEDPEYTTLFRVAARTSRFGVASFEWPIPQTARLGQYLIYVEISEGKRRESSAQQAVKISRYDLPNFTVAAKTDRQYYLPGQNAEVEVRADYIFGEKVARGRVKVVREAGRQWNFREQKWEIEEGDHYEGELDNEGRFTARINLEADHKDFEDSDYSRSRDINYAAYVTDLTTGRTERRRFDIRITREPVHVYVVEANNRQTEGFPFQFYVSTYYADGSPAECDVEINQTVEDQSRLSTDASNKKLLRRIKTDRYGVAKVADLKVHWPMVRARGYRAGPELEFVARDRQGKEGSRTKDWWHYLGAQPVIRIDTGKTFHRAGEPIFARIVSSDPTLSLQVEATSRYKSLASKIARLRQGRALVIFPYSKDFEGEVTIRARLNQTGEQESIESSRSVLYPQPRGLKIDARGRKEYRPGQEAEVVFDVREEDGRAVESALGVVVYDRAVEERAQADQQFGYESGFLDQFRDDYERLGPVRRKDLERIDPTKGLPEGLELVAEILLNHYPQNWTRVFGSDRYRLKPENVFSRALFWQLLPVRMALGARHKNHDEHPSDVTSLESILSDAGLAFNRLRDPWGTPYRAEFSIQTIEDTLVVVSAGPDKRFDTSDDFAATDRMRWPYFTAHGKKIDRAVESFHNRSSGYIRDRATLKSELMREGLDLDQLRDRWGSPYRAEFGINGIHFTVSLISAGPNRQMEEISADADDFIVWTSRIDYFAEQRAKIEAALADYFKRTSRFPQNETELREALLTAGIEFENLIDAWGRRCYATFKTEASYADRVALGTYAVYGSEPQYRAEVTPVTRQTSFVTLRSGGPDQEEGTADDFNAAIFSRIVAERSARESKPQPIVPFALNGESGTMAGTVTDSSGAVIADALVKATHLSAKLVYETKTDGEGKYTLSNLPTGIYEVLFEASGFARSTCTQVTVSSLDVTKIDATLYPGGASQTVEVRGGASESLMTLDRSVSMQIGNEDSPVKSKNGINIITKSGSSGSIEVEAQLSTPRLREYFPETLLWQPEIETDSRGRARLKFNLADNITTWKMAVVASTLDGRAAILERDIRAFQPFFIDHDPPRALTEGDEIALPIVLRNYLDKAQTVAAEIKPESWFALIGPRRKRVSVAAGEAAREVFEFRAIAPIKEGRQRVTGYGAEMSDAIEKTVTVRPDGEEIVQTTGRLFNEQTSVEIDVPQNAIGNSIEGELRIYPNLLSHIVESIEAIMQRPYGCAEQTISSAYPGLLSLRYYKQRGEELPAAAQRSLRYAQAGYEQLIGHQDEEGGFSYWSQIRADAALTAYALRFLEDASSLIAIDEKVTRKAGEWLVKHQESDGRWAVRHWNGEEMSGETTLTTAYVTRTLAASRLKQDANVTNSGVIKRALDYLSKRADEINEPYLTASLALAAADAGEKEAARKACEKLRSMARDENGAAYWAIEANTPFCGWGLAGRIETTALAIQALSRESKDSLVDRGMIFLIRNKDRYGVWYSTQATVNVLDAMLALILKQDAGKSAAAGRAEIAVNGRSVGSVDLPHGYQMTGPVRFDLSPFLRAGANRVEIKRDAGAMTASAQVVSTHFIPWAKQAGHEAVKMESSSALRLKVDFDKTETRAGEEIVCRVEAERRGFRGYGMMLAEIGLPPGADVDRASLDLAKTQSDWDLNRYDVLSDRVIVYLWPRAGGIRFEFKFRPRYGIRARSAPSIIYDYYNPEARATLAPAGFIVR
jgi:hypothetical protein